MSRTVISCPLSDNLMLTAGFLNDFHTVFFPHRNSLKPNFSPSDLPNTSKDRDEEMFSYFIHFCMHLYFRSLLCMVGFVDLFAECQINVCHYSCTFYKLDVRFNGICMHNAGAPCWRCLLFNKQYSVMGTENGTKINNRRFNLHRRRGGIKIRISRSDQQGWVIWSLLLIRNIQSLLCIVQNALKILQTFNIF